MKGRSKEAREQQAQRELLGRMRRKERYQVYFLPEHTEEGHAEGRFYRRTIEGAWYVHDILGGTHSGPFKTEKLAREALNRLKRSGS